MNNIYEQEVTYSFTKEDNYYYFKLLENVDSDLIREKIIYGNIPLVKSILMKKFYDTGCEYDDLLQVGIIGLIKAVDTFDITKGFSFSSYAYYCITNEILVYLRHNGKINNVVSLSEDSSFNLEDNFNFEDKILDKEELLFIKNFINNLEDNNDNKCIKLYYGFNGRSYNQNEIASMLNIDQSVVSRKIKKTLKEIKNMLKEEI